MTPENSITDDRHEQKIQFAQMYHVNRGDAVIIAARILGDEAVENPMKAINFGNSWPFDEIVIAELERLDTVSKAAGWYESYARNQAERCFKERSDMAGARLLQLAMIAAGIIKTGNKADGSDGKSQGHEQDLIDKIVDPDNRRDGAEQVPSTWK